MNNIYRENGLGRDVYANTKKPTMMYTNNSLYRHKFVHMGKTEQNILACIVCLMDDDMNTIQVGGDTLEELVNLSGYKEQTIRDNLRRLYPLLEKTNSRGEYIVNPLFAIKGNENKVWDIYNKIERTSK